VAIWVKDVLVAADYIVKENTYANNSHLFLEKELSR